MMIEAKVAAKKPERATQKIIKHHLKVKVEKPTVAKNILPVHVKEFIHNAQMNHLLKTLRENNVPEHSARVAAGEVYDPVEGPGAPTTDAWGALK
eukprot:4719055-Heterocapsa_arctica.AAC.1